MEKSDYKWLHGSWHSAHLSLLLFTVYKNSSAQSLVLSDSATPWTAARQAPLSMGFSRQEYWSGLPCPPPGDLPHPGIEARSPTLQAHCLPCEPPGMPQKTSVPSLCEGLGRDSQRDRKISVYPDFKTIANLQMLFTQSLSKQIYMCCPIWLYTFFQSCTSMDLFAMCKPEENTEICKI